MISEIVEYSTHIRQIENPELRNFLLGKPKIGFHLEVIFEDIISLENIDLASFIKEIKLGFYSKNGCDSEKEKWFLSILPLELESEYISNNKAVGGEKNIFSNNPFVIETKIGLNKANKNFQLESLSKIFQNKKENLERYYNALKNAYSEEEEILKKICDVILSMITNHFVDKNFWQKYIDSNNLEKEFQSYSVDLEKDRLFVIFRFKKIEQQNFENLFELAVNNYISAKVFNKDDYNFILNNILYGLSDFLNGDNVKKPFLKHLSTPFLVNNRISMSEAKELLKFSKFVEKKVLPNPLPIFIDEKELNEKVISIFRENSTIKFKELIRKLYEEHKKDLGNYYLIYFEQGDVRDIDYVSNFKYKLENLNIKNFDNIFSESDEREIPISDIFELEFHILRMFFSESYESDVNLYFTFESKDSALNSAFMSYKPMLYNFIYKSKQEWMQAYQWKKICESAFFYHLRKNKDFKNTYQFKEILKIYFSLNEHFDPYNQNFGGHYMPTKLPELHEKLKEIILNREEKHFDSDELFAFGAGQLIYYLLSQSEAREKTHQLLEPFLNKHRIFEFKKALEKTFEYYKYDIDFNNQRFNRLAREVFGYETDKDLAELKSFILAGYFANNVIYEKS